MKKLGAFFLSIACIMAFAGCGIGSHTETDYPAAITDYPAAIMVEGGIYLKSAVAMPAEVDESAIIGYTTSYTDTFPEKDGETNFNRELNMPYARVEGGVAVLCENEWYLCTPKDEETGSDGGTISFYAEPTREGTEPVVVNALSISKKQAEELRELLDHVDVWISDALVDRLAYYFDGHIEFAGDKNLYYFTYEHNVIYYNRQFAEVPAEDMQYIKDIALAHDTPVDLYLEQPAENDDHTAPHRSLFYESPPDLSVQHEGLSVQALGGTYSWNYANADGTSTGIEADSMHPLDAKEYMPVLSAVEGEAWLIFDTAPDEITVKAWSVSQWGDFDAVDDAVEVSVFEDKITLLEGGHIYEVYAKWTRFEEFGGSAHYSFCTSPLGVTMTAESITPTGLILVCTQSGGMPTGELQTGSPFWLETWVDGQWERTPRDTVEIAWTMEAWAIPKNKSVEWVVDWENIYYPLPAGRYRIGKEIMDFRGAGDYDEYRCYAEFAAE